MPSGLRWHAGVAAAAPYVTATSPPVDWAGYNNDLMSDRYSPLAQINTANVSGLHTICTAPLGAQPRFETGPVVIGGVLYATTLGATYAFNATTCAKVWTNSYALPSGSGGINHGVAYGNGRVFRGFVNGHVIAMDAKTGRTIWDRMVVKSGSFEYIVSAPIAWRGALYIGTAGGDNGQAAHVLCLDQTNGNVLWSVQTVPNLGDPLASTWQRAMRIAGGSTWTSYTLDPSSARLYVSVANPGRDFDVRERGGTNLYTDAVLALNAMTGALDADFQVTAQDDHDWDLAATPALVVLRNGSKVARTASKDGYARALNVAANTQLWQTPVTTISNAAAPIVFTGTHFCPGTKGGVLWNGPAFSPLTGYTYVNAVDWCSTVDLASKPQSYVPGNPWLGSSNSYGKPDAAMSGWVQALNGTTGTRRWAYHATTPMIAGITPTAGGLVFTADLAGNVMAFDASTGAIRRTVATGLAIGGGVVTYGVGAKQYVAVAAGMASSVFGTPNVNSEIIVMGL